MNMMYNYGFDSHNGSPSSFQEAQFGMAVFVLVVCATLSAVPMRYINKLALASFVWLLLAATLIVIVVPSVAPKEKRQNGHFVFATDTLALNAEINGLNKYANLGSEQNIKAFTVCNGLLMAQYLLLVFDVPGHMAEETKNASRTVPRAILFSFFSGSAINFGLLLAYLFSITNLDNASIPGFGITGSVRARAASEQSASMHALTRAAPRRWPAVQDEQQRPAAVEHQRHRRLPQRRRAAQRLQGRLHPVQRPAVFVLPRRQHLL